MWDLGRFSVLGGRSVQLVVLFGLGLAMACDRSTPAPSSVTLAAVEPPPAQYVGTGVCASCHEREFELWSGSHHDLAMQEAVEGNVLGDFDDVEVVLAGVRGRFFRDDSGYGFEAIAADGTSEHHRVEYAFGVAPLQQYLVSGNDGALQALTWAWDSRPAAAGGQRWYSLTGAEAQSVDDPLHWSMPAYNWNHVCGDCHSTAYRKGFDSSNDRFTTTFEEVDVACEACHGPGSNHAAWMEDAQRVAAGETGLVVDLGDANDGEWIFAPSSLESGGVDTTGIAVRTAARSSRQQVEACGRCHALRLPLTEAYEHGRPLLDSHTPVLLEEEFYYPDGQILDEVYVYGSFLQSRMYSAGVTCSDCHDPHRLEIASSDAVCSRCHATETFATPEHHFHPVDTDGARCVSCHMPKTAYMKIDPRGDHSFRVPNPRHAADLGTPDACSGCHADRSHESLVESWDVWFGEDPDDGSAGEQEREQEREQEHEPKREHWGYLLAAARQDHPAARDGLVELIDDEAVPAIVRATAVARLDRWPDPRNADVLTRAARSGDGWLRFGVARNLENLPPERRWSVGGDLLGDPLRSVRIEAVRWLAEVPAAERDSALGAFDLASDELRESLAIHADRASLRVGAGDFELALENVEEAERQYRKALVRDPLFEPTYVNLADLLRAEGRDSEGVALLDTARARLAESADLEHAYGLALVRAGRKPEAVVALRRAAELAPEVAQYDYVFAVALLDTGDLGGAVAQLESASVRHPYDSRIQNLLAQLRQQSGLGDSP